MITVPEWGKDEHDRIEASITTVEREAVPEVVSDLGQRTLEAASVKNPAYDVLKDDFTERVLTKSEWATVRAELKRQRAAEDSRPTFETGNEPGLTKDSLQEMMGAPAAEADRQKEFDALSDDDKEAVPRYEQTLRWKDDAKSEKDFAGVADLKREIFNQSKFLSAEAKKYLNL